MRLTDALEIGSVYCKYFHNPFIIRLETLPMISKTDGLKIYSDKDNIQTNSGEVCRECTADFTDFT